MVFPKKLAAFLLAGLLFPIAASAQVKPVSPTPLPINSPKSGCTASRCSQVFTGAVTSTASLITECQCYINQSVADGQPTEFITWVQAYVYSAAQGGEALARSAYTQVAVHGRSAASVCTELINSRPYPFGCIFRCNNR